MPRYADLPVIGLMLASLAAAVEASCHSLVMVLGGAGAEKAKDESESVHVGLRIRPDALGRRCERPGGKRSEQVQPLVRA